MLPFQKMVKDLVKPGKDILASLTPEKCNLIHMTWGITGEHLEILQALGDPTTSFNHDVDLANLKEELGDMEFFCEGFMQEMGWTYEELHATQENKLLAHGFKAYLAAVEKVSDLMKKHLMYNKTLTQKQSADLKNAIASVLVQNASLIHDAEWSREEILEANMHKLLKGSTARYKSGSFSDDQATARADKEAADFPKPS